MLFGYFVLSLLIAGIVFVIIYFRTRVLESSKIAERALNKGLGLAGTVNTDSTFTGKWWSWFGRHLLFILGSFASFGIAAPFLFGWLHRWRSQNTFVSGKQLVYTGTAVDFIKTRLWWILLTIITLGIHFLIFNRVNRLKFLAKYTKVLGEESQESSFDGNATDDFVLSFGLLALVIMTLGIAFPFARAIREQWVIGNTTISGRKIYSNMSGGQYMVKRIIWFLFSMLTFGFYAIFVKSCASEKYRVENLSFEKFAKDLEEDSQVAIEPKDKATQQAEDKKTLKIAAIVSGIVFGVIFLFSIISVLTTPSLRNADIVITSTENTITVEINNFELSENHELEIFIQGDVVFSSRQHIFFPGDNLQVTFTNLESGTLFLIEITLRERIGDGAVRLLDTYYNDIRTLL